MNTTLSIDEKTVSAAREVAAAMDKSLNQLIREELERLTRQNLRERDLEEFLSLSNQGDAQHWQFNRDELHERA